MGIIKQTEQDNGNILLEFIYGGVEAHFGGIDSSAPPAYIDPRCFAASDGFLIVDDKLVAASFQPVAAPTLWNGVSGVLLLKVGTFYNSVSGQLNYAFGYTATSFAGPPSGVTYTFYMTSWNPANPAIFWNDTLVFTLNDQPIVQTKASITLPLITSGTPQGTAGIGATFSASSVSAGGALTGITITTGGTGFNVGDQIGVFGSPAVGMGLVPAGNGWLQVSTIAAGGVITGVSIINAWYGFSVEALTANLGTSLSKCGLSIIPAVTGSGATVTITAVVGAGYISTFSFTGGTGYQVGDTFRVTQGQAPIYNYNANGAIFTVSSVGALGVITGLTLSNSGWSYVLGATTLAYTGAGFVVTDWTVPATAQQIITEFVAGFNAANSIATATASADGLSVIITAIQPGIVGNNLVVTDISTSQAPGYPPPFYFPAQNGIHLQGGTNAGSGTAPRTIQAPASTTVVGGTLYIAPAVPFILQYSGPGQFSILTAYTGVGIISKFGGSLIGLRKISQLGTYTQNQDMIFSWSAGSNLGIWSPVAANGNVTGAGFEQLADIEDYLSGLVVTSGTAFIIRAQGLSYATASGNATLPFPVTHIGLGEQGEGAQIANLVCQYSQTGVFVGVTDVFQISGSISAIGGKIKASLFTALNQAASTGAMLSANACVVTLGGTSYAIAMFSVGVASTPANSIQIYNYNIANGTWSAFTFPIDLPLAPHVHPVATILLTTLTDENTYAAQNEINTSYMALAVQSIDSTTSIPDVPLMYQLTEGLPSINSISNPAYVTFPQEEVMFGRDITIDALYVALWANVSENVTVGVYISGTLYATIVLTPAQFNTMSGVPIELQVFSANAGVGAFTAHSPQIQFQFQFSSPLVAGTAQIRFSKLAMFASFDPSQRPV